MLYIMQYTVWIVMFDFAPSSAVTAMLPWTFYEWCSTCNCGQIPLDQVHKYLELLNRRQDGDDQRGKDLSTETVAIVSVTSLATSTSNVTSVSLSSAVTDTEKTESVSQSPATDSRYVTPPCDDRVVLSAMLAHDVAVLWYDAVDFCALRSWRCGQLNLAHGTETKNWEKQKQSSSEETVRAIVHEGSPEWRSEKYGGRIRETDRF